MPNISYSDLHSIHELLLKFSSGDLVFAIRKKKKIGGISLKKESKVLSKKKKTRLTGPNTTVSIRFYDCNTALNKLSS